MNRISVLDEDGQVSSWFDSDVATKYEESTTWNGSNHISDATGGQWIHENLYKTKAGNWIKHRWSQYQGSGDTYTRITPEEAATWLVKCGHDPEEAGLAKEAAKHEC